MNTAAFPSAVNSAIVPATATRDHHVGQGQHVGQFSADVSGEVISRRARRRKMRGVLTQPLDMVGTALVNHVGMAEQPRQHVAHHRVDLLCSLCPAGDVDGWQATVEAAPLQCLDRFLRPPGEHLRPDRVARHGRRRSHRFRQERQGGLRRDGYTGRCAA